VYTCYPREISIGPIGPSGSTGGYKGGGGYRLTLGTTIVLLYTRLTVLSSKIVHKSKTIL